MNHSNHDTSKRPNRWGGRSLIPWVGALVLAPLVGGGATSAHWGWRYVHQDLIPQISADLSRSLHRPVALGEVEQLWLGGMRLGVSQIPAIATDTDTLTLEAVDIQVQPLASLRYRKVQLSVTLIQPQVVIRQEADGEWVATEFELDDDTSLEVQQIRIQNGTVRILPHPRFTADATPLQFERLQGAVQILDQGERLQGELWGRSPDSGQFQVNGQVNLTTDQAQLRLKAGNVAIAPLARLLPPEIHIQAGQISTDLRVNLEPGAFPDFHGTASLQDFAARAEGEPNPFTQTRGRFRLEGQTVTIQQGFVKFGRIPFQVGGSIHLQRGLNLEARVASLDVQDFMQTFKLRLPFAATGALKTDNLRVVGPFDHAKFSGTVTNAVPIRLDRVQVNARTDFVLDKTDDHLSLINLQVFPNVGGQITTNAEIDLKDEGSDVALTAQAQGLPADAIATLYALPTQAVTLGTLNATATVAVSNDTPQVQMDWQLAKGNYPAQGRLLVNDDQLALRNTRVQLGTGSVQVNGDYGSDRWHLQLAGSAIPLQALQPELPGLLSGNLALSGTDMTAATLKGNGQGTLSLGAGAVNATVQVGDRQWHSTLNASNIPLNQIKANLPGVLQGNATVQGDLAHLTPQGIRTTGDLQITQVWKMWRSPLQATFRWDGRTLHIPDFGSEGLRLTASLTPQFQGWHLVDPGSLNGQLRIHDYDLEELPVELPAPLHLAGQVNLDAALSGTVAQPQIAGRLALDHLAVNRWAFAPALRGTVQWNAAKGFGLDLQAPDAPTDRFTLKAQGDRRQFSLRQQDTLAEGVWEGDRLQAQVHNLEVAQLLPLIPLSEPLNRLQGKLSAEMSMNVAESTLMGTVALDRPQLGTWGDGLAERHGSDRLTAQIGYGNGTLSIPQGEWAFGQSRYHFAGTFQPATQQLQATLSTDQSQAEDVLTLAQWAAPQVAPQISLQSLLETVPLPSLNLALPTVPTTASGQLSGRATLAHSPQSGFNLNFDFNGQGWQLGNLGIQAITLRGQHTPAHPLTFETLALDGISLASIDGLDVSHLQFVGSLNPEQFEGDLQLTDVPLPLVGRLLNLPVNLEGNVSAIASLSGSLARPDVDGTLHLSGFQSPLVNINNADIGFTYKDTQFRLNSWSENTQAGY